MSWNEPVSVCVAPKVLGKMRVIILCEYTIYIFIFACNFWSGLWVYFVSFEPSCCFSYNTFEAVAIVFEQVWQYALAMEDKMAATQRTIAVQCSVSFHFASRTFIVHLGNCCILLLLLLLLVVAHRLRSGYNQVNCLRLPCLAASRCDDCGHNTNSLSMMYILVYYEWACKSDQQFIRRSGAFPQTTNCVCDNKICARFMACGVCGVTVYGNQTGRWP